MLCSLFRPSQGWREAPVCLSMVTLHPTDIFETFSESLNIVTDCWTMRRSYTISLLRLGQPGRSHEGVGQKKLFRKLEQAHRHLTCYSLFDNLSQPARSLVVAWCEFCARWAGVVMRPFWIVTWSFAAALCQFLRVKCAASGEECLRLGNSCVAEHPTQSSRTGGTHGVSVGLGFGG